MKIHIEIPYCHNIPTYCFCKRAGKGYCAGAAFGKIYRADTTELGFSHVVNQNRNTGAISNKDGFYTIYVHGGDTILMSSVGYKLKEVVVNEHTNNKLILLDVFMEADTIEIKEVKIFPWKTYEEFRQAFIELELDETLEEIAQRKRCHYLYSNVVRRRAG
ncbi:MAG: hypothetical protein HC896_17885 [Bacteroidales bacterium]|nr:hypothetical protein [Bacteroidales bacterium]